MVVRNRELYARNDDDSAFRSEHTEALDAAQEDYVSLDRWVFKWRLKVRMFSHRRMPKPNDISD